MCVCFRTLRSLLSADGVNKSLVTVFIDGIFDVSMFSTVAVVVLFFHKYFYKNVCGKCLGTCVCVCLCVSK